MTPNFTISLKTEIVFGPGRVTDLLAHIPKGTHVLLVRGASGVPSAPVAELLKDTDLTEVSCPTEPNATDLADLLADLRPQKIDLVVACGGGSVMDLGKALAALLPSNDPLEAYLDGKTPTAPVSCITIPTTAGTGAEVTRNAVIGLPEKGAKFSLRGPAFTPSLAIVDPNLMRSAPPRVILGAGLDAVTQMVEAYTSNAANAFTDNLSWPGIDRGLSALKSLMQGDETAWPAMAWTATASGIALSHGGLGVAHGLASIIGGRFDAPHGELCGRLIGPVLSVNASAPQVTKAARSRVDACIAMFLQHFPTESENTLAGFSDWCAKHELPYLRDWGVGKDSHESIANAAMTASSSLKNPVALEAEQFRLVLSAAQ
ncbi:MAG: iron-containing alcohol dehydrogenase [Aliishimia sp.]